MHSGDVITKLVCINRPGYDLLVFRDTLLIIIQVHSFCKMLAVAISKASLFEVKDNLKFYIIEILP